MCRVIYSILRQESCIQLKKYDDATTVYGDDGVDEEDKEDEETGWYLISDFL